MKIRTLLLLLIPALLAVVGTATAQGASRGRLDRSFGHSGIATVVAPKARGEIKGFAIGSDGRAYVLKGSSLLALNSRGTVARRFGEKGQVSVAPAFGKGPPVAFAVDSQGRLLLAGSTHLRGQKIHSAYVIRLLPDGKRDASFGSDGEVDTDFALPAPEGQTAPSVHVNSITAGAQDRPIVGGSFGAEPGLCTTDFGSEPNPFIARLTATGALDESFDGSGHAVLGRPGEVESFATIPGGGFGAFSHACAGSPRFESRPPDFSAFDESGMVDPLVTERPLGFSYFAPAVDPSGRIVELESPPPAAGGPDALSRYLPSGERDPGFGNGGTVTLRRGYRYADAFAVDAQGRPIIAVEAGGIELRRFLPNGGLDRGFGRGALLTAKGEGPSALALDTRGRIYTLGEKRKSQPTIQLARFIPGS